MIRDLFHSSLAQCFRDQRRVTREMTYLGDAYSNAIRDSVTVVQSPPNASTFGSDIRR